MSSTAQATDDQDLPRQRPEALVACNWSLAGDERAMPRECRRATAVAIAK
jgi:hypothetical protein